MGEVIGTELPPAVMNFVRGGRIVIVATVDEDGKPNSAPFSWAVARDSKTIRIGINHEISTLHNIRRSGQVSMTISSPDIQVTMKGTAKVVKEMIEEAPLPTAIVEVTIHEVRDDGVIGRPRPGEERVRWMDRRRLLSDTTIISALLRD